MRFYNIMVRVCFASMILSMTAFWVRVPLWWEHAIVCVNSVLFGIFWCTAWIHYDLWPSICASRMRQIQIISEHRPHTTCRARTRPNGRIP